MSELTTGLVVQPYRTDQGRGAWVFRCWGSDSCDGWLSLDHSSQQSAERARDRHIAESHPELPPAEAISPPAPQPPEFVLALYEDDGTLLFGIHPDGQLERGPNYQPDVAARELWDAVTRAAQAANPWGAT